MQILERIISLRLEKKALAVYERNQRRGEQLRLGRLA